MFKGSKVSYKVSRMDFDPVTEKYDSTITGRYMEITIKASTEDECYNLIHNLVEHMTKEYGGNISLADCPTIEQHDNYIEYYDIIEVSDHEQYDELKDIYKEWKKSAKTITMPLTEETESNETTITEPTITAEKYSNIDNFNSLEINDQIMYNINNSWVKATIYDITADKKVIWIETDIDLYKVDISDINKVKTPKYL